MFPSFGPLNDIFFSSWGRDLEPNLLGLEECDFDGNNCEKNWLNFSPDINLKIGRRVGREAAIIPTLAEWLFPAASVLNENKKNLKQKEMGGMGY